jgi:hypothetical protein
MPESDPPKSEPPFPPAAASILPPSPPPPAPYFRPPRLGIIHFLAWITVAAVILGLFQSFNHFAEETLGQQYATYKHSINFIVYSINFIIIAAKLVGMTVVVRGRIRRQPSRWQPGHFLITAHSIYDIFYYSISLVGLYYLLLLVSMSSPNLKGFYFGWCLALIFLYWIKAALFFWWWKRSSDPLRWKTLFFLEAMIDFLVSLPYFYYVSITMGWLKSQGDNKLIIYGVLICTLLLAVIYLSTAILDYRRGPRRDWVHWLGIATTVLMILLFVCSTLFH